MSQVNVKWQNFISLELLIKGSSLSIHLKNIQALAIELYKIKNGLSPELITEIFARETESNYNLTQGQ